VNNLDAQTLQELIDARGAALALYARQWCSAPEDAVQEALVELLRQHPPPENLVGWLYTTVRRRAMNQARAAGRQAKHLRAAAEQREMWFTPCDPPDSEVDLKALLTRLPNLEREIVIARIWGELSFAQIAELVDQPLSTVHRRYQQALAELERKLTQLEHHEPETQTNESKFPNA